jgi:hypothetical protein
VAAKKILLSADKEIILYDEGHDWLSRYDRLTLIETFFGIFFNFLLFLTGNHRFCDRIGREDCNLEIFCFLLKKNEKKTKIHSGRLVKTRNF